MPFHRIASYRIASHYIRSIWYLFAVRNVSLFDNSLTLRIVSLIFTYFPCCAFSIVFSVYRILFFIFNFTFDSRRRKKNERIIKGRFRFSIDWKVRQFASMLILFRLSFFFCHNGSVRLFPLLLSTSIWSIHL